MNDQDRHLSNLYLDDQCPECEFGAFCTHNTRLVLPCDVHKQVSAQDFHLMVKECMEPNIALVGPFGGSRIKTMKTRVFVQEKGLVESLRDLRDLRDMRDMRDLRMNGGPEG